MHEGAKGVWLVFHSCVDGEVERWGRAPTGRRGFDGLWGEVATESHGFGALFLT